MKRIVILALFFSMVLYPASLKSGLYKAEYDYSALPENTYITEKIVPCEGIGKNAIMRRYKCGDLKIFKDGKTVFLEVKSYMDTGNFVYMNTGKYLTELTEQKDGIYYGKNDYIDFYVKKISKDELEITIVSRIKYSSTEFPMRGGAYVPEGSDRMTFRYKNKVTENDKSQAEESAGIFEDTVKEMGINYGSYKKLEGEIYYSDKKVDSADFDSFMVYKSNTYSAMVFSDYAKDKNGIFYAGKLWKEADYNSFQFLGESYSKDKNNIYYSGKKINGADIDTFEIINWAYAKDKKYVYLKGEVVKGQDPAKFKL
ncbi:DKNYY domain-containing protein [Sebaldella sp. S0638]|uniref:DKNYY domain-containing protein n=1 Tax=Sebaldella sp. S0638 TaxID=2957809 RepID=UPI00209FCA62|nr:DKNYY domain-containing protein [Sebaldella sp. S0638]MCP1223556.1 DKNYY domain-containing protein [Sebaldella sp. S0638]